MEVKRNELKYFINHADCHALVNRLRHVLAPDVHSIPHQGYWIRSLYFDSFDEECMFEKQGGAIFRQKYRMRIYDPETKVVKFEIKHRLNSQVFKETASISRESAYEIINGNYDELLRYNDPILNKIYRKFSARIYKPKVIVDYTRDAFVFDHFNLRITIDKELRSGTTNFDIFSKSMHLIPAVPDGKYILEVKYDTCLPEYIWGLLQMDSSERMAISKYVICRRFLKINKWEDN